MAQPPNWDRFLNGRVNGGLLSTLQVPDGDGGLRNMTMEERSYAEVARRNRAFENKYAEQEEIRIEFERRCAEQEANRIEMALKASRELSDNAAYKKRAEGVVPPLTYSGLPMLGQAPQLKGYTNQSMVQLNNGRSTEEFCNIVQLKIPKVFSVEFAAVDDATKPPKPTLGDMPRNVLALIFDNMGPDDKTMLALVNRKFLSTSRETNNGKGVIYKRPLHKNEPLFAAMKKWMGPLRKHCTLCDKFRPIDSYYWTNRWNKGLVKPTTLLCKRKNSFEFNQVECPECFAGYSWERIQQENKRLRDMMFS